MSDYIDITGIDRAELLASLYNRARPLGMGFLHFDPNPMSKEEAQGVLKVKADTFDFDYLKGRVMKVWLGHEKETENNLYGAWLYDRDNGEGACEKIIAELRAKS